VLADNLAETVADSRARTISVSISIRVLGRKLLSRNLNCSDLLDRADTDTVGLAQGAIDRPSFGYAHFGSADERRNIGRIGVTVANKAGGALRRIGRCLEDKPIRRRITERIDDLNMDAAASLATRKPEEAGVCNVPATVNKLQF